MKVVKITALWCSACLIMNKRWDEVLKEKKIETVSLDIDMDEEEVKRIVGEKTTGELLSILKEVEEKV